MAMEVDTVDTVDMVEAMDIVVDMVVAMGDMVMGEVLEVDLEVEKEDMGGVLEVALEAEQDMVALGVDMGDMIMAKEV